ncbi:MAG: hypothetical protein IH888_03375 [Planctomycetes bacterium]|nr:hypothetical protein [Planctomycetota bacterium]
MRVGGGLLFLIALLSIGDCASDGRAASGSSIEAAIKQLTREARRFQTDPLGLPAEPDFARRFEGTIEADDLDRALSRRTHRNPFIDAYVRWQLISFADDSRALGELDEQLFGAFMRHAPAMVANPRADRDLVALLKRGNQSGPLSGADLRRLQRLERQLNQMTKRAELLNRPAIGFYEWAQKKLGPIGPRPRQWLLCRCAATIAAGWPARSIKSAISRAFTESVRDRRFTPSQRRVVADQSRRLIGLDRTIINQMTFLADGSLRVTFSRSRVEAKDAEAWVERLMGKW